LEERAQDSLSLATVFSLLMTDRNNIDLLKKAIAFPDLAEACRNDLKKILTFAQRNSEK
jgi:MOSC domain-containing protein YiiM